MVGHEGLIASLPFDLSQFWDIFVRLLMSVVLGSVIGFERARRDKPAGFRTNILISLGACVFTVASQSLYGPVIDQTRVAAQVVSGVGFLGAGAILRDAKGVVGLTTAATIWAVAAVGMSCGFAEYGLAVGGTFFIMLILVVLPSIGVVFETRRDLQDYRLETDRQSERLDELNRLFETHRLKVVMRDCFEQNDRIVFQVKAIGPKLDHERFRHNMILRDDWQLCESAG
jgi:putative Mg2+ transporter-C (MgtC) family protein